MAVNYRRVTQIGIVVEDIETEIQNLEKLFGMKVTVRAETPDGHKLLRGEYEDFCAKLAVFDLENIQIELIQPIRGNSVWQEFLDKHGSGIHHIQFQSSKYADDKADVSNQWGALEMEGESVRGPQFKFGYFNTYDTLNFMLELSNPIEVFEN